MDSLEPIEPTKLEAEISISKKTPNKVPELKERYAIEQVVEEDDEEDLEESAEPTGE